MRQLRTWLSRLTGTFSPARQERTSTDFADELESHLQLHIDDNLRAGMSPEQARRRALLKLGGVEPVREAYRDGHTLPRVEQLWQDVRFAIRQWRRSPAFSVTATIVLALGISASVAIFGFVDAALLKPLPYREPSRLVAVFESSALGPRFHLSYLDYQDWKRSNTVFDAMDVYDYEAFMMSTSTGVQQIDGARVSAGIFRTLGVTPVLGRDFREDEDLPSAPRTLLLTYAAWQTRFGGQPGVLGQTITLDRVPHTIIGVLPQGFHFAPAEPAEFWVALPHEPCHDDRGCHDLSGVARLKDGVTLQRAAAEMTAIAARLEQAYPDSNRQRGATLLPLTDQIVGDIRPILLVLLGGAGLLLLIACVNVASLLLVRSESRKREIAVRGALGASRARLLQQFVTEGLVLTAGAGALGVAVAGAAMQLLTGLIPAAKMISMPYLQGLGLNGRVLLFAGAIAPVMGLLFALTPMLRLSSADMREGLSEGARGSAGLVWRRLGAHFVVLELATAMVLLAGAGLLGVSFYRLIHVDTGLRPDHLAMMRVAGPETMTDAQMLTFKQRIVDRVASLPGVTSVAVTNMLPVGNGDGTMSIVVAGRPPSGGRNQVTFRQVSAGYFQTLQARLVRGRYFTGTEDTSKARVAILNQTTANKLFPGEDAVGQRIFYDGSPESLMEIVGVVSDIKEGDLASTTYPALYVPFDQRPFFRFYLVVRTAEPPAAMLPTLAAAARQNDPTVATYAETIMDDRIHNSPTAYMHRASTWLVGGFAFVALLLGSVGLYGVVAYSVSQRTREIGIRVALGAERRTVYRLILREAGWLTTVGIAIGFAGSLAMAMVLRPLFFGIDAWNAPALVAVAIVLAASSLLASYIPARRAASIDPMEALRPN
jgi:predicted permease